LPFPVLLGRSKSGAVAPSMLATSDAAKAEGGQRRSAPASAPKATAPVERNVRREGGVAAREEEEEEVAGREVEEEEAGRGGERGAKACTVGGGTLR